CGDTKARLWAVPTGALIGHPMEHGGSGYTLAFDPTGKVLATGGNDRLVRLWDGSTGAPVSPPVPPLEHQAKILSIAFSPDGRTVATASKEHTARVWPLAGPVIDDPHRIAHWVAVRTDLEFGPSNAIRRLDSETWRGHRRLLTNSGGPPLP